MHTSRKRANEGLGGNRRGGGRRGRRIRREGKREEKGAEGIFDERGGAGLHESVRRFSGNLAF